MTNETPEQVQRRVDEDRARIDRTMDAIGDRFSPGQLLDQAVGYVRTGGRDAGQRLVESFKENPYPLLLTGVGLAWLMASTARGNGNGHGGHDYRGDHVYPPVRERSRTEEVRDDAARRARAAAAEVQRDVGETESKFEERVTEAKARALSLQRQAGENFEAFSHRVGEYMHRAERMAADMRSRAYAARDRAGRAFSSGARSVRAWRRDAQEKAQDLYFSEPLIVGAVSLAAGALVGALMPSTRFERENLGEYGEMAREQAREAVSEIADRGKAAALEGYKAAKDTALHGESEGRESKGEEEKAKTS